MKDKPEAVSRFENYLSYAVLFGIIAFTVFIRLRLLHIPLDRDEGGWAYAGWLITQGIPPYAQFYHMKLPGIYYIYAFIIKVFGSTAAAVHAGLMLVNIVTILGIFTLAKKLFSPLAGAAAAVFFSLATLSFGMEGFSANTEQFAVFACVISLLLLLKAAAKNSLLTFFFSGIFAGLAFIIKQPGAFVVAFGLVYIVYVNFKAGKKYEFKNAAVYLLGPAFWAAVIYLTVLTPQAYENFINFVFRYTAFYAAQVSLKDGLKTFMAALPGVTRGLEVFIFVTAAGLMALAALKRKVENKFFMAVFFAFSAAAVCAGLYFRPHYFILLAPAAALLTGMVFDQISRLCAEKFPKAKYEYVFISLMMLAAAVFGISQRAYLFIDPPQKICKKVFGENPFVESVEIAKYIKENTAPGDTVAVFGSEPQMHFYSGRRSATGFIYMIDLMGNNPVAKAFQIKAIEEIKSAKPAVIVFVNIRISWLFVPGSGSAIFDFYKDYTGKYYEKTGVAELVSPEETLYIWGKEAKAYKPTHGYFIDIYKRKAAK